MTKYENGYIKPKLLNALCMMHIKCEKFIECVYKYIERRNYKENPEIVCRAICNYFKKEYLNKDSALKATVITPSKQAIYDLYDYCTLFMNELDNLIKENIKENLIVPANTYLSIVDTDNILTIINEYILKKYLEYYSLIANDQSLVLTFTEAQECLKYCYKCFVINEETIYNMQSLINTFKSLKKFKFMICDKSNINMELVKRLKSNIENLMKNILEYKHYVEVQKKILVNKLYIACKWYAILGDKSNISIIENNLLTKANEVKTEAAIEHNNYTKLDIKLEILLEEVVKMLKELPN